MQGCPGSGKSTVIEYLSCCVWDSELCGIEDMPKYFSTIPVEKDEDPAPLSQVRLIKPEYDADIEWDEPAFSSSSPEELNKEAIEEPGLEELTTPPTLSLSSI